MIATCLRAKMVGSTRGLFRLGFRITAAWPLARQSICPCGHQKCNKKAKALRRLVQRPRRAITVSLPLPPPRPKRESHDPVLELIGEPPVLGFQPGFRLVCGDITRMGAPRQNDEDAAGVAGRNMERTLRSGTHREEGSVSCTTKPSRFLSRASSYPPPSLAGQSFPYQVRTVWKRSHRRMIRAFRPGQASFCLCICICSLLQAKPSTESVAKRRQERNLTWSSAVGRMQAEHECPGEASRTAGDIPVPRAHGCFTRTVGACTTRLGFGSW